MSNKEKYKQAFAAIQPEENTVLELKTGTSKSNVYVKHGLRFALSALVIFSATTFAYAKDIGGMQRTIQIWLQGDLTDATFTSDSEGHYVLSYTDEDGNEIERGIGGLNIDSDGNTSSVTEEQIEEYLSLPEVIYEEDGSVWIYWKDTGTDITDLFNDGICYIKLVDSNSNETQYVTVKYDNGYACSPHKYLSPDSFN